jgi:hypothetical protein
MMAGMPKAKTAPNSKFSDDAVLLNSTHSSVQAAIESQTKVLNKILKALTPEEHSL